MKYLIVVLILFGFLTVSAQNKSDKSNNSGKYSELIKSVKLKGKEFRALRRKLKNSYDLGYHEALTIGDVTIPAGYWIHLKEGMPKVTEKTEKGVKVEVGVTDAIQFGKALAKTPEIYVWKKKNPVAISSTNAGGSSSGNVDVFFEDNGTYHPYSEFSPTIRVNIEKEATKSGALWNELELTFKDKNVPYDISVEIHKQITMKGTLTTNDEAEASGFTVKKKGNRFKKASLGYGKTIEITKFDYDNKLISGEFIMDPVMEDDARVKVVFRNIKVSNEVSGTSIDFVGDGRMHVIAKLKSEEGTDLLSPTNIVENNNGTIRLLQKGGNKQSIVLDLDDVIHKRRERNRYVAYIEEGSYKLKGHLEGKIQLTNATGKITVTKVEGNKINAKFTLTNRDAYNPVSAEGIIENFHVKLN